MPTTELVPGRRTRRKSAEASIAVAFVAAIALVVAVAMRAPSVLLQLHPARFSSLGFLLGKQDPPWVAQGQMPLQYYEVQSRVKGQTGIGDFWPGVNKSAPQPEMGTAENLWRDVRPNRLAPRPEVEGPAAWGWAPSNGRGVVLIKSTDGTPFTGVPQPVMHGFMGQACKTSDECQSADVCTKGKCRPAVFDGAPAVEKRVKELEKKMWPAAKAYGQQQLRAQTSVLRELTAQTHTDEAIYATREHLAHELSAVDRAAGATAAGVSSGRRGSPVLSKLGDRSFFKYDAKRGKFYSFSPDKGAVARPGSVADEIAHVRLGGSDTADHPHVTHPHVKLPNGDIQGKDMRFVGKGHLQKLAMGSGTPVRPPPPISPPAPPRGSLCGFLVYGSRPSGLAVGADEPRALPDAD